jgi:hypothetical protein
MIYRMQFPFTFGGFVDKQVQKIETSQEELQDTAVDFLLHMARSGIIVDPN